MWEPIAQVSTVAADGNTCKLTDSKQGLDAADHQYLGATNKTTGTDIVPSPEDPAVRKRHYRRPKTASVITLSIPLQKHLTKSEFRASSGPTSRSLSSTHSAKSPTLGKQPKYFDSRCNGTSFKSHQNRVNQKRSLDVPKIYLNSQDSSISADRHTLRSNSPPPQRFSEISFLKILLDTLPMERNDSLDSTENLSAEGVDGEEDIFGEITPVSSRGARKISTASLGCLRESLKTSRGYGKAGGNERMQRSRSASQMMTTAASVEKLLFRNRLM
ncbi:hypothetical protein EGW08_011438 [Elysia chlorotica]|uniref:Uncharacterized protein n=1 Tax=Elysia chlorotica TaxID=188477 RepID=A0A3S1C244_ELYCH|nr:hypothetical protein EGW08_011438 [Elysia chlorotica]